MCLYATLNSYSVTAVKTVLFQCIVMYLLLDGFSLFLQEQKLLLCSYFLSACGAVLIASSTTLKINSCSLLQFLGLFSPRLEPGYGACTSCLWAHMNPMKLNEAKCCIWVGATPPPTQAGGCTDEEQPCRDGVGGGGR